MNFDKVIFFYPVQLNHWQRILERIEFTRITTFSTCDRSKLKTQLLLTSALPSPNSCETGLLGKQKRPGRAPSF